mmetsp:Transcript_15336/g.47807  ORF Transcript_15336/g.47807 Transcript_15336/m.47807 type:complete len:239 (+) Transcript_15336:1342-2058(+)
MSAMSACALALNALPNQLCALAAGLVPGHGSAPGGGADQNEPPHSSGSTNTPPSASSTTAVVHQPRRRAGTTSPKHESPKKAIASPRRPKSASTALAEPPASMCSHGRPGGAPSGSAAADSRMAVSGCAGSHATARNGESPAKKAGLRASATMRSQHAASEPSPKAVRIVKRAKSACEFVTMQTRSPCARSRRNHAATRGRGWIYACGLARSALKKPPVPAAKAGCRKALLTAAYRSS